MWAHMKNEKPEIYLLVFGSGSSQNRQADGPQRVEGVRKRLDGRNRAPEQAETGNWPPEPDQR